MNPLQRIHKKYQVLFSLENNENKNIQDYRLLQSGLPHSGLKERICSSLIRAYYILYKHGGKNENGKVVPPETVPNHLRHKCVYLCM